MDDGFVRESHEEIVEDSVHDDDSVNDPNYVQESESDGVIEWTAENIHKLYKVVKETEDALDHGESDCNNEEVQEAGNRTIERENTIADVTDDALDDLPCTRGLKNSDCVFDGHLRKEREENERENHGGDESSMDDGFVRESHEEIVEDSVHDDDSVNDP
ncbi:MAG: hypothetical protein ABW185_26185, partial [Sedimenticola sp.]